MPAVDARGLVKRFETTVALDGVDLLVGEGEVHGLLGPNGAGKTTLLRLLFGLIVPDAGTIELFGRRLAGPGQLPLDGVAGFVEDPTFYPYLSGRANLELLAELDGRSAADRVEPVLEQVGLAERGGDRVSGYSTGMRQRLGIASALLRSPQLLLLDEPTSGLDPAGAREIRALVRELCSEGVGVLVSSHQIGEIEDVCDGFTVLRRGKMVWHGTAAQLRDAGAIVEDIELPDYAIFSAVGRVIMMAEAFAIHEADVQSRLLDYGEITAGRFVLGAAITAADLIHAQRARRELTDAVNAALTRYDALLMLSALDTAPRFDQPSDALSPASPIQTIPFNVTGHPAMSVPIGLGANGLPIGMQVAGRAFDEAMVFRIGHAVEKLSCWETVALPGG